MAAPPPFLTIVVTGRHDNYGGDFNERFFTALRFNHQRLAERDVPFEVVLVEWNPVPDRPTLSEVVARECPSLGSVLRRVVVAPEYHVAFTQNPRIPYLEYLAKNVGIRRAAGAFVLASNTDILLGHHVVDVIASRRLRPGVVYRAARYDIKLGADQLRIGWDALENPANHIRRPTLSPPFYAGGSGDFALADRDTFHVLRGYNEIYRAGRHGVDHNFLVKAHGAGVPIEDIGGPVYHINHVGSYRISKALYRDNPKDAPWGDNRWHSRHVVYSNPDRWGLGDAPARQLPDGSVSLDFDWRAVPPIVELRRVVLPIRQADVSGVEAGSM
jgi:hypothetical protein